MAQLARQPGEQEQAALAVRSFLRSIDTRSWNEFEAYFEPLSSVFVPGPGPDGEHALPWSDVREPLKQSFEQDADAPRALGASRRQEMVVDIRGANALVSFASRDRRHPTKRAIVMSQIDGDWKVRHVHVSRLPTKWPVAF
jgi:hypothetical protein